LRPATVLNSALLGCAEAPCLPVCLLAACRRMTRPHTQLLCQAVEETSRCVTACSCQDNHTIGVTRLYACWSLQAHDNTHSQCLCLHTGSPCQAAEQTSRDAAANTRSQSG
jgi:hypothetical protein